MNRAVYDALQPLYAAARAALPTPAPGQKAAEPAGLVFRKRHGDSSWGSIRTAFEGACREAKIPDFRFHDRRHTCASWLVMKGEASRKSRNCSAQSGRIDPERLVSPRAPVAQADRAAVS